MAKWWRGCSAGLWILSLQVHRFMNKSWKLETWPKLGIDKTTHWLCHAPPEDWWNFVCLHCGWKAHTSVPVRTWPVSRSLSSTVLYPVHTAHTNGSYRSRTISKDSVNGSVLFWNHSTWTVRFAVPKRFQNRSCYSVNAIVPGNGSNVLVDRCF